MYTKKLIAKELFYNNNSYYPVFTIVNVIRLCNSFLFLNNTQFVIYTYLYSLMNIILINLTLISFTLFI